MSTLFVNKLKAAVGSVINLPSGQRIKSEDTGGIVAPGQVVQVQQYYIGGGATNDGHHTSVTTPGTGAGSGANAFGRGSAVTTSSQTPTASEFQVDITPKFDNSLIRIEFNYYVHTQATAQSANCKVVRTISGGTATSIWQPPTNTTSGFGNNYQNAASSVHEVRHLLAWDKPNTTTSTNYRIYYYNYAASSVMYFAYNSDNHWSCNSALTVTEIAQ